MEAAPTQIAESIDRQLNTLLSAEQKAAWKENCIETDAWRPDGMAWFKKISSQDSDIAFMARLEAGNTKG